MSFRKRDNGGYSVLANIDAGPHSSGGHWFDVDACVPPDFNAMRVSGDAYNNHGEFRGRHSVVITRDYGVWHIEGVEGDNWDIANRIVTTVEAERREDRDKIAKGFFGVVAGLAVLVLGSSAPVDGTEEVVLISAATFGMGGFLGGYFARPRGLPQVRIYDRIRETKQPRIEA